MCVFLGGVATITTYIEKQNCLRPTVLCFFASHWTENKIHLIFLYPTGQVRVTMEEDLGVVDFYPSAEVGVVYIPEGEIVAGPTYRRKLCKLRKVLFLPC